MCSSDLWASEMTVREESTGWLQGYFLTCYETLEPDELETYAAFWRTAEGKVLNAALFAVFDQRSEERRVGKECRSRWSPYH